MENTFYEIVEIIADLGLKQNWLQFILVTINATDVRLDCPKISLSSLLCNF